MVHWASSALRFVLELCAINLERIQNEGRHVHACLSLGNARDVLDALHPEGIPESAATQIIRVGSNSLLLLRCSTVLESPSDSVAVLEAGLSSSNEHLYRMS